MTKLTITAAVNYEIKPKGSRVKTVTYAMIKAGNEVIATRHLSGRFSQEQVLVEFRRFPLRFQMGNGISRTENVPQMLMKLALVS